MTHSVRQPRRSLNDSKAIAAQCAQRLFELRRRSGETQKQFATRVQMTESMISRLERGDHVPNLATLCRLLHSQTAVAGGLGARQSLPPDRNTPLTLITDEDRNKLLANGREAAAGADIDPFPVVKIFVPDGNATWLLSELNPADPDVAYGLADLGKGMPAARWC